MPFVALYGLVLCAGCVGLGGIEFRRTGLLLTPLTIFLGLAVLDVFLPGSVLSTIGLGVRPAWISGVLIDVLPDAMTLFAIGVLLFAAGYFLIDEIPKEPGVPSQAMVRDPNLRLALCLFTVIAMWQVIELAISIHDSGSLIAYSRDAVINRFRSDDVAEAGILPRLASAIRLPVTLAVTGILFVHRHRHPVLYGWVVPLTAGALAAATLLRGSVLVLFIGCAFAVGIRPGLTTRVPVRDAVTLRRLSNKIVVIGVAVFILATVVRNEVTAWVWEYLDGEPPTVVEQIAQLARGETLVGVASIMDHYGREGPFLNGKTIVDMLLLPVPRSIYQSKPTWYGIDDITRGMGWPPSTQSAVGMPGELYANFGYAGIVGMLVFGALFGLARRAEARDHLGLVYGFILLPAIFPTFWMSFTGFVSQLTLIPIFMAVLWVIDPTPIRRISPRPVRLASSH
jgi:hypothetical protein